MLRQASPKSFFIFTNTKGDMYRKVPFHPFVGITRIRFWRVSSQPPNKAAPLEFGHKVTLFSFIEQILALKTSYYCKKVVIFAA